jgi:hypothetical protein
MLELSVKTIVLAVILSKRNSEHKIEYDFLKELSGQVIDLTVCENHMGRHAACLTQIIVAHAIFRDISLDSISVNVEGDVDLRGFSGLSMK